MLEDCIGRQRDFVHESFGADQRMLFERGQTTSEGIDKRFDLFVGQGRVDIAVALGEASERIRCKATYNVNSTGLGLKQTLRCASDSYKFDLSTDVTSEGNRIHGNWSEASRNLFGNLQGTAGGGQIGVFVEASGFAASVTLRTTGSKQTVQINSKGEIRAVNITMSKGG
ncbi:MAG TPA: hypothetical protein VK556_11485 [Candidatus Udaeobacter sp.]|nr:hypothetical protein [Candidatus Udaeobacter sp.]